MKRGVETAWKQRERNEGKGACGLSIVPFWDGADLQAQRARDKKRVSGNPKTLKQGYQDSNLEMTESESVALPFGDSPSCLPLLICDRCYYTPSPEECKLFFAAGEKSFLFGLL